MTQVDATQRGLHFILKQSHEPGSRAPYLRSKNLRIYTSMNSKVLSDVGGTENFIQEPNPEAALSAGDWHIGEEQTALIAKGARAMAQLFRNSTFERQVRTKRSTIALQFRH